MILLNLRKKVPETAIVFSVTFIKFMIYLCFVAVWKNNMTENKICTHTPYSGNSFLTGH